MTNERNILTIPMNELTFKEYIDVLTIDLLFTFYLITGMFRSFFG